MGVIVAYLGILVSVYIASERVPVKGNIQGHGVSTRETLQINEKVMRYGEWGEIFVLAWGAVSWLVRMHRKIGCLNHTNAATGPESAAAIQQQHYLFTHQYKQRTKLQKVILLLIQAGK